MLATLVLLVALPPLAAVLHQPFWVSALTRILIYALIGVSLDLIVGYAGLVSFGHAAYFAVGGYTVAVLAANGVDAALVAWPAAVLASALLATVVGALSLRTSGIFFIMITLAFAQMVFFAVVAVKAWGGNDGLPLDARSVLPGIDLRDANVLYFVCLVALIAYVVVSAQLVESRLGMVLRGIRRSERRVLALGFPAFRYKLVAFVLSAAGTGFAGALWAEYARFVSPDMAVWSKSGEFLVMVILGGMGTVVGPIYGAAVLLGLESVLSGLTEHGMMVLGAVLLVIVLFAKRGLYGWLAGAKAGTP
ncbi:MAG: branched-chain amino acid ABC transporter permease [Candidatus Elarobacter sp.]